jgi:adenylate cyclase class 2
MLEVEQKFAVPSFSAIEAQLRERGVHLSSPIAQADRYFSHPSRDFAQTDEALRIRQVGDDNRITYKGPKLDKLTKTRREIELPLAPGAARGDEYAELLQALSFTPVAVVRKTRRIGELHYQGFCVEIALDDVESVGTFVELEISADESSLDAARTALLALANDLGLRDVERRSYLEMLLHGR